MEVVQDTQLAHIRFSTQIIKRLGEELNPSIDQSILELVKNAYDADAKSCIVEMNDIKQLGGSIKITDNGVGMDDTTIIDGWLVLGQSSKSVHTKTKLGRTPAGSKGLGRLAALRMGNTAELISTPEWLRNSEFHLTIDWNAFDNATLVDDVDLPVKHIILDKRKKNGTSITVSGLKQNISEREVKKIARGLILLSDPFGDDPETFKPVLKAPEFKEMENLVAKRYFDDADYHLVASVNQNGIAEAKVLDYLGNELFVTNHKELADKREGLPFNCPPTTFDLWAFILNSSNFTQRQNTLAEVRNWLNSFGGVHLYENSLRVNPYGNPGNDWLDMNLSRARSPEERPSTNTSIGIVRVQDSVGLLSQKTDRSGFIENDTFVEIRNFCQGALEWMAKRRLELAEIRRQKERTQASANSKVTKQKVQEAINTLEQSDQRDAIQKLFSNYEKTQQDLINSLRIEVQLYRTLSTAGIMAATFSHESRGNPLKVIDQSVQAVERRIKDKVNQSDYDNLFVRPIQSIIRAIRSLSVLGSATLKLISHEKRRLTRVDIHAVIRNVQETFKPFLDGRDITLELQLVDGNPFLRSSEAAVESIITNLINNSMIALEHSPKKLRKIKIETFVAGSVLNIVVKDNGPGIQGIPVRDIWLPGQTTNTNGTGLGLTIVRDAAYDLGGEVNAKVQSDLGGAEISISLPIIGL